MLLLFALPFLTTLDKTGHPSFAERERATTTLIREWPASVPALLYGLEATDPEVRVRSLYALKEGRLNMVYGGKTEPRLLAEALLYHEHEIGGVPWAKDRWAKEWGRRVDVRASLSALATELKLRGPDGDDLFGFEVPSTSRDPYPYGLDDLRFRVRGITSAMRPFPTDPWYLKRLKAEWDIIKESRK